MEPIQELSDLLASSAVSQRRRVVKLVRRLAGATTDAILDPSMKPFFIPGIEGFIAYRIEMNSAIVFGDPTCTEEDRAVLTQAFHRFAAQLGKEVIYISVSQSFAYWALENDCNTLIEFGKELTLDPACDPAQRTGDHGSLVRRKVRAALREKLSVHEYTSHDASLQLAMEQLSHLWLKARRGVQIHISNIYLFQDTEGKRWFYAKQNEKLVGLLCLNLIEKHQGWLLNHLMTLPDAPPGTSELLVTSVLKILNEEGCRFVTVGVVTPQRLGKIIGLGSVSKWMARLGFNIARKLAHLDGLNTFWSKFHPQEQPAYLLFSQKKIGLQEIIALKQALSGNHEKST